MYCKFCGAEIDDDCVVCPHCGKQVAPLKNEESTIESIFGENVNGKNKIIAALLALFLGEFGIQHFYLGNKNLGIISAIFFWTGIPWIIGIVQGIMMLLESDEEFAKRIKTDNKY
ncbi:MAG: TM2 domain-containing protein [Bacilli bacterium]|nr:TM2 domain-containing protein [Bacilli bacterium]